MPGEALALRDVLVTRRGAAGVILDVGALDVGPGERCGIAGASGSGKTTLLHLAAGLLAPARGRVAWGDVALDVMTPARRDAWRRTHVGLVFQAFHLVPELSARDNVLLPVWFAGWSARGRVAEADALLARMGIATPLRRAGALSRGEQQRVAVARALLHRPAAILADEPTASLDAESGAAVADLLLDAARETGATLLVVSHDPALLARMDRVVTLAHGQPR